uniref:Uncharacterized protein n=1 Tax=Meloidogyne enterolobii TaxID=390850 RepID=A0A6V7VZ43_MELEN|nr:unnamed protein product [Meloidogyne enterolobii]
MLKFLIIICLIIKTHSWTWEDYPSPREATYWKCGVSKPTWVCDPDGMLTDQQRKEIVDLPKSNYLCMREGLRLVVALAKTKLFQLNVCTKSGWTSSDPTKCESDVQGLELNTDGFKWCYTIHWLMTLQTVELENLSKAQKHHLNETNYFVALKDYIINLRMLYINRFSIFDNHDPYNELIKVQNSLQDTNRKLSELQQIQGKMFIGKNITTTSSKFIVIFSNNL